MARGTGIECRYYVAAAFFIWYMSMDDLEKRFAAVWEEVRQENAAREAEERAAGSGEKIQGEQIRSGSRKKSTKQNATREAEKPKQATVAEPVNTSPCLPSVADVETVERVKGEVLDAATSGELSPEDIAGLQSTIYDFIVTHVYDDSDDPPEKKLTRALKGNKSLWGALCIYVGQNYTKKYGICNDKEYIRKHGTNRKNPYIVESMAEYFSFICALFGSFPLVYDFCYFAGISWNYFDGNRIKDDGALTSSQVGLAQKFRKYQENDLARRLAEGAQNPTGTIFTLKNWFGWKDERTVEHVDGTQTALKAAELPRLDGLVVSDQ